MLFLEIFFSPLLFCYFMNKSTDDFVVNAKEEYATQEINDLFSW